MSRKKKCSNCKHREFSFDAEICMKDGDVISYDYFLKDKKACKYYKRDFAVVTAKELWKYDEINGKQYIWTRGKFKKTYG